MRFLAPSLFALLLLVSCGSDSEDLVEEEPIAGPPEEATEAPVPRLLIPPIPVSQPQPLPGNPFRVPEVTGELPQEKTLLSRPVAAPAAGDNASTQ